MEIFQMLAQIIHHLLNTNQTFKYQKIGTIPNGVKIAVPLKYLRNFWRSLEMSLINCKVEL